MDESVYPKDSVGALMNAEFINVQVQMDKTANDNEFVKSWYNDAKLIGKLFHIEGYPSFLFLNPQGEIIYRAMGGMNAGNFLNEVRTA